MYRGGIAGGGKLADSPVPASDSMLGSGREGGTAAHARPSLRRFVDACGGLVFGDHGVPVASQPRSAQNALLDLISDPVVGDREAFLQGDAGRPAQFSLDQGVVAVATSHALWGTEVVLAVQLDAGEPLGQIDQLVDGHQFVAAEIQGFGDVRLCDTDRALDAVVDVHEAAGLFAVAPDLDLGLGTGGTPRRPS